MSKAIVDTIISDMIRASLKKSNDVVRSYMGANNPHFHTITKQDMDQTITLNCITILQKDAVDARQAQMESDSGQTEGGGMRYEAAKAIFSEAGELKDSLQKVADVVWQDYVDEYNRVKRKKDVPAKKEGNVITIYQSTLEDKKLKEPLFNIAKKAIEKEPSLVNVMNNWKTFTRQTQFLHTERTVGLDYLTQMDRHLSGRGIGEGAKVGRMNPRGGDQASFDKKFKEVLADSSRDSIGDINFSTVQARNAAQTVIQNMIASVAWEWSSKQQADPSAFIKNITVRGTLGPTVANKPGEESTDWTHIRPLLEKKIEDELNRGRNRKEDFVTRGASPSPKDLISTLAVNMILKSYQDLKGPGITVKVNKRTKKVQKRAEQVSKLGVLGKQKKLSKSSSIKQPKGRPSESAQRSIQSKETDFSPISLMTLLNRKLPDTLLANMTEPALVNRTGTFRQSVKVSNVVANNQYPTVQYKYQQDPYKVFEQDSDRDPRKLIDKSIREIAAQVMRGRFYTQRVS